MLRIGRIFESVTEFYVLRNTDKELFDMVGWGPWECDFCKEKDPEKLIFLVKDYEDAYDYMDKRVVKERSPIAACCNESYQNLWIFKNQGTYDE